ncbi:MAG: hypothetical protein VR64_08170 [Desulfatitalea sp. BRH_c12]|nr:MAG: hypothetical protein VR64_08170 [Desulfatitalea sp. BRH_c12]
MQLLKKEWRTVLIATWLLIVTVFLVRIESHLGRVDQQSAKTASTLDSVESVTIGTDAVIVQLGKKVDEMDSNVNYIVQRVRRR